MRTYIKNIARGFVSPESMQRVAEVVIKDGRKIKTVVQNLEICHMTIVYRSVEIRNRKKIVTRKTSYFGF